MVLSGAGVRTIIASVFIAGLVALLGGLAFIYSGRYHVAATNPHWQVTRWVLKTARIHSIKAHAVGITVPPAVDDSAKILIGVEHFAAHCAVCHGAPGVPEGDIARGLYPPPPDLAKTAQLYSPAELFWIIKHGIKMTGMPAWSDHSDEELWAIVVFLEKLPGITEQDYARLVATRIMHGGGHYPENADHNRRQSHPVDTESR